MNINKLKATDVYKLHMNITSIDEHVHPTNVWKNGKGDDIYEDIKTGKCNVVHKITKKKYSFRNFDVAWDAVNAWHREYKS